MAKKIGNLYNRIVNAKKKPKTSKKECGLAFNPASCLKILQLPASGIQEKQKTQVKNLRILVSSFVLDL